MDHHLTWVQVAKWWIYFSGHCVERNRQTNNSEYLHV